MRKATLLVILLIIASLPSPATADENPVRQRSNMTEFTWVGSATTVQVSGEWDDWQVRTDLVENNGSWIVELSLNPGMYCYKLIIDNNWIFDPAEPYRGYCGSFENSIVRVPDASIPMFTHEINNQDLTVYWHAGTSGGAPEYTPSALTNSSWDAQTWTWSLDLSNLPDGKNTLHINGEDVDGNIADDLLLPFWNGPQADFVWEDALIYMIMTDRFVNGNNSNDPLFVNGNSTGAAQGADWMGGDFAGITQMIHSGHFTNLGVNALWLTPFNSAANGTGSSSDGQHEVSAYHGYWPVEPRGIDSRLGTEAELHELVDAAHDAGIRIMGDFVVNHVHEDHPYYSNNPEWFNQGCLCGSENCDWTEHRLDCLFSSYMPDVNWRERNASEQFISDVIWWMETFDLDGGRIDAVKHVEDLAITNLAVRINERFETAGTDYYLKGETAMGWAGHNLNDNANEYGTINNYIGPNALDGQADFVLYHAVVDNVFTSGNMDYAHLDYWTARSQDQYVEGAIMVPFVGSHDVPRFTSRADTGTSDAWNQWVEDGLPGQPGIDGPYQTALQAYTWLLTTPGSAMIYQGDEYGEFGGADPDNRHMWRNISNHNSRENSIMENISAIGQLRLNSDALRRGTYSSLSNGTDTIAWSMTTESDQAVIAMNRGTTSAEFNLLLDWVANDSLNGIVMSDEHEFTLPPHSVAIFFPENENITTPPVEGCTDANATNFDPLAEIDDGTCEYQEPPQEGCTDSTATNYDSLAEIDDGSCEYEEPPQEGCTDAEAINFDILAEVDDGTCEYSNPDPDDNSSNVTGNQTDNQTGNQNSTNSTDDNTEDVNTSCNAPDGTTYEDGETWGKTCNTCSCENGEIICTTEVCDSTIDDLERTQGGFSFLTGAAIGFIILIVFAIGAVLIITQSRRD